MDSIVTSISNNAWFVVITGIASILGTLLSVVVIFTTSSIKNTIKRQAQIRNFIKEQKLAIDKFDGYIKSITEDNILDHKLKCDMLSEIHKFRNNFDSIMTFTDRFHIWFITIHLKNEVTKIDRNRLCNQLSFFKARFNKKEDPNGF